MTGPPQGGELEWLLEQLSRRARTSVDEFGSFYAFLEGSHGGETVLLWAPIAAAAEVVAALPLSFKGRLVLGLDASPGHLAPFARALYWAQPRRALVVAPGEGLGSAFAGAKEVAPGEWATLDDPREPLCLEVDLPGGFRYREPRRYDPWQAAAPTEGLPGLAGSLVGAVGWEQAIPTYTIGLVGLRQSLGAVLAAWRLTR